MKETGMTCLLAAILLLSASSKAQIQPKLNGEVALKPYDFHLFKSKRSFTAVPITLKLTHFISKNQFPFITKEDLKISLLGANTLSIDEVRDQNKRFYAGVGGEILSFRDRVVMLQDGTGKQYRNLDILSVEAVGLININEDVYLSLKVHVASGPQLSGNAAIYANTPDQEQKVLNEFCPNCIVGNDTWSSDPYLSMNAGATASVTVRKFKFSLYSDHNQGRAKIEHSYPTLGVPVPPPFEDRFTHIRKFSQGTSGMRLSYQASESVALFLGYKLFRSSLDSRYEQITHRIERGTLYEDTRRGDMTTEGEFKKFQVQFLEAGFRFSPSVIFQRVRR